MVAPAIPAESGSPWLDSFIVKPRTQDSFFAASTQAIAVGATFDKNMQQLSAGDTATPVYVCAFCSKIKSASYFCYFLNIAEVKTQEGLSGGGSGRTGTIKEPRFSDTSSTSINVVTGLNFTISQGGSSLIISYTTDTITLYNRQVLVPSN